MIGLSSDEVTTSILRLIDRTSNGRTKWETMEDGKELVAMTSRFMFLIQSRDQDDNAPYEFEIWRRPVGEENKDLLKVASVMTSVDNPMNDILADLYQVAKISVFGLVNLKKELLDDLE